MLMWGICEQTEATEVFFAVTKLFQSKDIGLRRMVYLMIKEISPSNDEVILLPSSSVFLEMARNANPVLAFELQTPQQVHLER